MLRPLLVAAFVSALPMTLIADTLVLRNGRASRASFCPCVAA